MKVALVHDWLNGMRGGEAVLEAIAELFPEAPIYTLVCEPDKLSPALRARTIHTSPLQKMPGGISRYRHYLPLMPRMIESFDLAGYDLIVSSSHCVAKGIRKPAQAKHLSYVHAPMRYMWDRFEDYFGPGKASVITRAAAHAVRPYLQGWDRRASQAPNVDRMVANSEFIARQIHAHYGRDAGVIHPFADLARFERVERAPGEFYLMFGAFAPYKRFDLAVRAANEMKLPLVVAGSGQDEDLLRRLAGPTVKLVLRPTDAEVTDLYARCRALLFPGVEDFGIVPVEAMASGVPVLAYGEGGACETVGPSSGILFLEQSIAGIRDVIRKFEVHERAFTPEACRAHARDFSKAAFQAKFREEIARLTPRAASTL